jgi:uncharacterized membrane protein YccC
MSLVVGAADNRRFSGQMASALRSAAPALLFGLRLWASVCLALYVAFWLQLDTPAWAGTSAGVVCQPILGASLRKGAFRMVGTVVGAVAIVVLSACFPQSRVGFLLGLALWGAACALGATLLRNFAGYSAALAGYTAAIVASDELGATGGTSPDVFIIAVTRASEICIGIICAGLVLVCTDLGGARRRLATLLAGIAAEITRGLTGTFRLIGAAQAATRPVRWDLTRRVVALNPVIDQAFGEASDLRYRSRTLQAAVDGLFAALSSWRTAAYHLERMSSDDGRREAEAVLRQLPPELGSLPAADDVTSWIAEAPSLHRGCEKAIRALVALPADTPSLRLLADRTAEALWGLSRGLNGLVLLTDPARAVIRRGVAKLRVPDPLPGLINALRAFVTISAVALFWIITGWPNGAAAITWATIAVLLFSPHADRAYAGAKLFTLGIGLGCAVAAILNFAVLPGEETFAGISLALGLVLIPGGALATRSRLGPMFGALAANFSSLLGPANQMSYDPQQFYNSALAIFAGNGAAALAMCLIPPLSPTMRARRLLKLTLRDLRRLTTIRIPRSARDWEGHIYGRLAALPEQAEPIQRTWLLAALSVGTEVLRLRRIAPRFGLGAALDAALRALSSGDSALAIEGLGRVDCSLAKLPAAVPAMAVRLRARGSIRVIAEALAQHGAYFDEGTSP